jgi:hypothetical protein
MKNALLVLCGAAIGGVIGYLAFAWMLSYGLYGLVLPGGLLGIGAGIAKNRSLVLAVACGLFAVALGLFAEWRWFPFIDDKSLSYFVAHLGDLNPVTWLMILVGGIIGFWCPYRYLHDQRTRRSGAAASE